MPWLNVAVRCVGEFKAQEMANTAWAFARVVKLDEALFVALTTVA